MILLDYFVKKVLLLNSTQVQGSFVKILEKENRI